MKNYNQEILDKLQLLNIRERWQYYDEIDSQIREEIERLPRNEAIDKAIKKAAKLWGCSVSDIAFEDTGYFMPQEIFDLYSKNDFKWRDKQTIKKNAQSWFKKRVALIEEGIKPWKGSIEDEREELKDILSEEIDLNKKLLRSFSSNNTFQKMQRSYFKKLKKYLKERIKGIISEKKLKRLLNIGMEAGFWDRNNNVLLKKGEKNPYSTGKKFLGQLSLVLVKLDYLNDGYSPNEIGEFLCDLFNEPVRGGNDPYKEFDGKINSIYGPIKSKFQECESRIYPKNNS